MKHIEDMIDEVHTFLYLHVSRKAAGTIHAGLFVLVGWCLAAIVYHVL